jgi:putative hemolysin
MSMWGIELVVMVGMIAFNSVFAAYEIALASISNSRLHSLVGAKKVGANAALYMKQNMEGSLAGVQLGITLVGAIAAATGGAGAEESIAPYFQRSLGASPGLAELMAIATLVAPLTVVTIIFGELIPKVFALRNKEWVCLRLSPAMRMFVFAVWPVVWLLENAVTGLMSLGERHWQRRVEATTKTEEAELQELRASVALARTSRLIGPQEERIILGAAALSQRLIREVMLPASAISMLDANASIAHALVAAHLDMHTRFPLTERAGDPQAVIGYVNFKDIVAHMRLAPHDPSLRAIMREILSLPEESPVALCMERMIRDRTHIALIRNSKVEVIGMVTLEDIIEELVGDIEDEYDRLPVHSVRSGTGWVVGGGIMLDKLRMITGITLPSLTSETPPRHLSDWVLRQVAAPLQGGEIVEKDGVRVVVRKIRRQHVLEAQVNRLVSA